MTAASYHPRILFPKYGQTDIVKPLTANRGLSFAVSIKQFIIGRGFSDIRNSEVLGKVIVRGYHTSHVKQLFVAYSAAVLGSVGSFPLKSLRFDGATWQWFAGVVLAHHVAMDTSLP